MNEANIIIKVIRLKDDDEQGETALVNILEDGYLISNIATTDKITTFVLLKQSEIISPYTGKGDNKKPTEA